MMNIYVLNGNYNDEYAGHQKTKLNDCKNIRGVSTLTKSF